MPVLVSVAGGGTGEHHEEAGLGGVRDDGRMDFPFVDGVPALAGAFQLLLQFGQGGRGFLGETDEIAGVPIEFGDLAWVSRTAVRCRLR